MFSKILTTQTEKIIGLEISPDNLSICYAEKKAEKVVFKDFFSIKFEEESIKSGNFVDEEKLFEFLNSFVQKNNLKNSKINIAISSNDTYVKKITLPDLPDKEMALVVLQEIEKNLPISPDELYIDYAIIRRYTDKVDNDKKADIIYVAVQKYLVQNYINLVEKTGLKINSIELSIFSALKTAMRYDFIAQYENNTIVVFVDYENTDIMFLKDGLPLEISSLPTGRKELKEIRQQISVAPEAEKHIYIEKLINVYDNICFEISGLIDLFYSQNRNEKLVEKILLISKSSNSKNIEKYISEKTSIECFSLSSFLNFEIDEKLADKEIQKHLFNSCSGLVVEKTALIPDINVLRNLSKNVQKYSKEFFTEEEKKKVKVLCALSTVLILICTAVWGYLFVMNTRTLSEYKRLEKKCEIFKPRLEKISAQSEGLKEKKEILRLKLLAKDIVAKDIVAWSNILTDIASIVPKDIKIKEITRETPVSKNAGVNINIKGQIPSTKESPLKMVSFFAININSNLPTSTKLTNASIKDIKFNDNGNFYEFNITSDLITSPK